MKYWYISEGQDQGRIEDENGRVYSAVEREEIAREHGYAYFSQIQLDHDGACELGYPQYDCLPYAASYGIAND